MNALTVLFGGSLSKEAFEPLFADKTGGASPFECALERAARFPGTGRLALLGLDGVDYRVPGSVKIIRKPRWDVSALLLSLSEESAGFDFTYYAWADTPFLDPALAEKIAARHLKFAADYSYADGFPQGLAPEILSPGTAGILYKIAAEGGAQDVKRDSVFSVLQKDINAFDIETELSAADFRCHRLTLAADSKRNALLVSRFAECGCDSAEGACDIVAKKSEILRTLPAFFPIEVSAACPPFAEKTGSCALCPRTLLRERGAAQGEAFMDPAAFSALLDRIAAFAGDAVIDLSLWGELSLHPQAEDLVAAVLEREALSLVIETSGIGWLSRQGLPEKCAALAASAKKRVNGMESLSWIVSLNSCDTGDSTGEAVSFVRGIRKLFPREKGRDERLYVQAVRVTGDEDQIERFYRSWQMEDGPGIIIQKYNNFCGFLPGRKAADLSPVIRRPCWHIMRDMPVLLDGSVPLCAQDIEAAAGFCGNVFSDSLEKIWEKSGGQYAVHCRGEYTSVCADCDEYYTFNF